MTTTPTERRLAITPGKWEWITQAKREGAEQTALSAGAYTDDSTTVLFHSAFWMPNPDDLVLIADAGNTYQACGLTPSELLAKVEAITIEIQGALVSIQSISLRNATNYAVIDLDDWRRILSTLNLPTP